MALTTSPFNWSDYEIGNQTHKYQIDLLAAVLAWKRMGHSVVNSDPDRTFPMLFGQLEVVRAISPDDLALANQIRHYFGMKITVDLLKTEGRLSKYRTDLASYLANPLSEMTEQTVRLVYRLPDMYQRDIELERLAAGLTPAVGNAHNETRTIQLLKTFEVGALYSRKIEHWFRDVNSNELCMIRVHKSNELLSFFTTAVSSGPVTIRPRAIFLSKATGPIDFWRLDKVEFVYAR